MLQGESADAVKRLDPSVEALRERALRAGISLRTLARCAGVHHSTLSRMWRGKLAPSERVLTALAACLSTAVGEVPAQGARNAPARREEGWPVAAGGAALQPIPLPHGITPRRLLQELDRLSAVARSSEVRDMIHVGFRAKRRGLTAARLGGGMLARLDRLFRLYEDTGWRERHPDTAARVAGCLLYFILTQDEAPDDTLPYGYLDDAWLVDRVWAEVQAVMSLGPDAPVPDSPPPRPLRHRDHAAPDRPGAEAGDRR